MEKGGGKLGAAVSNPELLKHFASRLLHTVKDDRGPKELWLICNLPTDTILAKLVNLKSFINSFKKNKSITY